LNCARDSGNKPTKNIATLTFVSNIAPPQIFLCLKIRKWLDTKLTLNNGLTFFFLFLFSHNFRYQQFFVHIQIMKFTAIALLAILGAASAGKPQLSVRLAAAHLFCSLALS
jgi:hypothetical protein